MRSPPSSPPHNHTPHQLPSSTSSWSSSSSPSSYSSTQTPHTQPSTIEFQLIVQARYVALILPTNLNVFPAGYLKYLPRYNGETSPSAKDHLQAFLDFVDNMNIEQENVYMRLFVQSLEGNVRI